LHQGAGEQAAAPDRPVSQYENVRRLAELAELLGPDIHIQTDYGDEGGGLTPWELFDEADSRQALAMAEEAVKLAQHISAATAAEKTNE
jgi:hypothetical protein